MQYGLTEQEFSTIQSGIRKIIRLQGLIHDPSQLVWMKWLADESELKEAIDSVRALFKRTSSMLGKQKYHNASYDACRQVREDILSCLTSNSDGKSATLEKRNLPMYYAVILPLVDSFQKYTHQEILDTVDSVCDGVKMMVDQCVDYGSYDDALIAQQQIRDIIRVHEEALAAERESKKRKRKQRDPLAELLAIIDGSDDEWSDEDTAELI